MSAFVPFSFTGKNWPKCEALRDGGQMREHRSARAGLWHCRLVTLTPLSVQSYFREAKAAGDSAYIPGTSLRGMIRNTVQMLGGGCFRFHSDMPTCNLPRLCLACHMFGFVGGLERSWQSLVVVSDTDRLPHRWVQYAVPVAPPHANEDGWLTFRHLSPHLAPGPTWCIEAGEEFAFTVEYRDLDPEEYALLRLAVSLDDGHNHLCHKLGFGKAAGLGSCRVFIDDGDPPVAANLAKYRATAGYTGLAAIRSCA